MSDEEIEELKRLAFEQMHEYDKPGKVCVRCGHRKLLDDFPVQKNGPMGRGSWCRDCMKEYAREAYRRKKRMKKSNGTAQYLGQYYVGSEVLEKKVAAMAKPKWCEVYMCDGTPPIRIMV